MNTKISFGSLFAGIGGFDLGFERAGMVCKWQCEIDEYARAVLRKHWPEVPKHDDIRTFEPTPVDVVCGGFPCQDISNAGKLAGINEGTRSGLWIEYVRIVRTIRPRFVVVENVAALLVRGFDRVLRDLAESGYDAEWAVLSASAFGAYHERQRVFVVAYPAGKYGESWNLLEASPDWRTQAQFRRFRSMVDATERRDRNIRFESEPRLARMVHGVRSRTHRIECLGNAIYPPIAKWLGDRIAEAVRLNPDNARHHLAAGEDIDLPTREPPPLKCMALLSGGWSEA